MLMGDSKRYIEWEINNNIIKGVSISHQYPIIIDIPTHVFKGVLIEWFLNGM